MVELFSMTFHVVTGLCRSGSTLFCNVLSQNPKFRATDTSLLPNLTQALINNWSNAPEVVGDLQDDPKAAHERLRTTLRGVCDGWHSKYKPNGEIIFDKSRLWTLNYDLLKSLYPDSKMIILVKDLREVVASCERHYRKYGFLEDRPKLFEHRLEAYFNEDPQKGQIGIIAEGLAGIRDLVNMNVTKDVYYLRYEDFVNSPKQTLTHIHNFLDEPHFDYDFNNVEKVCNDPDYIYRGFFPHEGSGAIYRPKPTWNQWMNHVVGDDIIRRNQWFFYNFEYTPLPIAQQVQSKE
jgi:sulfotransferase